MSKNLSKYIQLGVIVLLLAIFVVANIIINNYKGIIDQYITGYAIPETTFDTENGNLLCQTIAEEGFVLLKNGAADSVEDDVLPLKDTTKINLFGWSSSDAGFLISGGGSGDFTAGTDYKSEAGQKYIKLITALEGRPDNPATKTDEYIEGGGFECNPELIEFYDKINIGARDRNELNKGWFDYGTGTGYFRLVEPSTASLEAQIPQAVAYSDTALVVLSRLGGESKDLPKVQYKFSPTTVTDNSKTYLELSTEEEEMLELVKKNFTKIVVIFNTTNVMEAGFLDAPEIDGAIWIGTPGQSGVIALANILRGKANPSGKLTDTYAYNLESAANYACSPNGTAINSASGSEHSYLGGGGNYIDYIEGIYVGYKWYETADDEGFWDQGEWSGYDNVVQYPFGFGLSYTSFDWTVRSITPGANSNITPDTEITIQVDITNTGKVAGKDVVQIYYNPPYTSGGVEKASKNLIAFAKTVTLYPENEADADHPHIQTLTLKFKAEDMKSYDADNLSGAVGSNGGYVLEKGDYNIYISTDAHNVKINGNKNAISGSGVTNGKFTYKVATSVKIAKDSTSGYTVENRFTGDSAEAGISIDGRDTGANIDYLTRKNFVNSFPKITTASRAKDSKMPSTSDYSFLTQRNTDIMPTTGVDSGLRLTENGELNLDLILELGSNYEDEKWETLLNQISQKEFFDVVNYGGYVTWSIPSIGKPKMADHDGPSGFNIHPTSSAGFTGFPCGTVVASTWSTRIAESFGISVGIEGNDAGYGGLYGPGVNIHRSPFSGRNYEYFSEDAYISGIIGAYFVKGTLSQGIYSYIKHFVVNEAEFNRDSLYTWLSEQTLREIYLRPFELCVKGIDVTLENGETVNYGANALMTSYNRLGAIWTGGSYHLMTEILRKEWGFKGSVVTDYLNRNDDKVLFDVDVGIRAGNDIWLLNGSQSSSTPAYITHFSDRSSATAVACAREATKNVVFTYCSTIYLQTQAGNEAKFSESEALESIWIYGWIFGDIVAFGGLAVWTFLVFRKLIPNLMNAKKA